MVSEDYPITFEGKTAIVTGATRGIGKAIALRAARDGARVAVLGKTVEPHPKLPGTIWSAADEITEAGGSAIPIACDIRFDDQVAAAVEKTVSEFGGIDVTGTVDAGRSLEFSMGNMNASVPGFLAVDDPVISIFYCAGFHPGCIGAMIGLGNAKSESGSGIFQSV